MLNKDTDIDLDLVESISEEDLLAAMLDEETISEKAKKKVKKEEDEVEDDDDSQVEEEEDSQDEDDDSEVKEATKKTNKSKKEDADEDEDDSQVEEEEDSEDDEVEKVDENIANFGKKRAKPFKKEEDSEDDDEDSEVKEATKKTNKSKKEEADEDEDDSEVEDEEDEDEDDSKEVKEALDALIGDTDGLTEDFKKKAATIFEAAISERVRHQTERLQDEYIQKLDEETEAIRNGLVEDLDTYLEYTVTEWMNENKIAIEAGLRTENSETFMKRLQSLFSECYVEVPESKVDLYSDIEEKAAKLEAELTESKKANDTLAEEVETLTRQSIIDEASEDLADTQALKLKSLVEDVEFVDSETFAEKVETVKETYFSKNEPNSKRHTFGPRETIIEEDEDDVAELSESMAKYAKQLKKS